MNQRTALVEARKRVRIRGDHLSWAVFRDGQLVEYCWTFSAAKQARQREVEKLVAGLLAAPPQRKEKL